MQAYVMSMRTNQVFHIQLNIVWITGKLFLGKWVLIFNQFPTDFWQMEDPHTWKADTL